MTTTAPARNRVSAPAWKPSPRSAGRLLVVALSLAVAVWNLLRGTGFVLDDWYWLRNAHFGGALEAASGASNAQAVARPGAGLVYTFVFGVIGQHPAAIVAVMAVANLAFALVLLSLLERYLPQGIALVTVALWIVFANHTSLEVWASCANIPLALLLGAGGLVVAVTRRSTAGAITAAAMTAAAALCYQAVVPVLLAGLVLLPYVDRRRLDRRLLAWSALFWVAALGWMATHWDRVKNVSPGYRAFNLAVPAHFGWGIVPEGAFSSLATLGAVAGIGAAVYLAATHRLHASNRGAAVAIGAGVAVMALGLLPFAGYLYEPLGAGDRASCVSAVGGALVWAGIAGLAWATRRGVAVALTVVLLAGALVTRWNRIDAWHRAGVDSAAAVQALRQVAPAPETTILVTPLPPVREDVTAFLDRSNIDAAAQLATGDRSIHARLVNQSEASKAGPGTVILRVAWP